MKRWGRALLLQALLPAAAAVILSASIWIVDTRTQRKFAEICGEMERQEGRMDGLEAVRLRPRAALTILPADEGIGAVAGRADGFQFSESNESGEKLTDAALKIVLSEGSISAPVSPAADPGRSREVTAAAAEPGAEEGPVDAVASASETLEDRGTLKTAIFGEESPAGRPEIVEKKRRAACRKLLRQEADSGSDILPAPDWLAFLGRENPDDGSGRLILLDRRSGRIRRLLSGWEEGGWKLGLSEDWRNIVWVEENCYYLPEP